MKTSALLEAIQRLIEASEASLEIGRACDFASLRLETEKAKQAAEDYIQAADKTDKLPMPQPSQNP